MSKNIKVNIPVTKKEFKSTLMSHGWNNLKGIAWTHTPSIFNIPVTLDQPLGIYSIQPGHCETLDPIASQIFSLDFNINSFHNKIKKQSKQKFDWIIKQKRGRFLRSATLFEDCLKMILTTNTTWSRTKSMWEKIYSYYGINQKGELFPPSYKKLLRVKKSLFHDKVGTGYRTDYIFELAETVKNDINFFLMYEKSHYTDQEFHKKIKNIRGLGPVSIDYICRMYGRLSGYATDSWVINQLKKTDREFSTQIELLQILEIEFGDISPYGPLALWLELVRKWDIKSLEY